MFSFFKKDPTKKLKAAYEKKLEQAMTAQRSGDIEGYAKLTDEANEILAQIDALSPPTSHSATDQN